MAETRATFGANSWIVEELYRDFLTDPSSVPESWHDFFADYVPPHGNAPATVTGTNGTATSVKSGSERTEDTADDSSSPAADTEDTADEEEESAPVPDGATKMRGVSATIAENMESSLTVPTATSIREVPAKLLEVNRKILNNQLLRTRGGKVSFTHLIGWAMVKALIANRAMTKSYHVDGDGTPYVHQPETFNLGLAVDVERKGGRVLLVPNIKGVDQMTFAEYWRAYEEMIRRIQSSDLSPDMFEGTTATLTNPGGLGTVGSVPRLMRGQSAIIGVGAIDYPSQFKGSDPRTLADLGVGKVITLTSTYDHRVIQGAESGLFLGSMEAHLLGEQDFYDEIFDSLRVPYEPVRWRTDNSSRAVNDEGARAAKEIGVQKLTNMYRVRGHLIANLNPLQHTFRKVHPELDPATYGLTIWDLDREFYIDNIANRDRMALGDLLGVLRDAYCRTVGIEYMHISDPEQKAWFQQRLEGVSVEPSKDDQVRILRMLNEAEAFERFLGTKYLGQKRFSLEGSESLIPMLDALLTTAIEQGLSEAVIGMAHRGRLNVLANVLGKSYDRIFSEFEGDISPDSVQGSGDVKYHLGARGVHHHPDGGQELPITLAGNPSHLEAVDPVVEGMVRAKQDQRSDPPNHGPILPILIHGDAAFAGQGVVAETLGMSQLKGYQTGGTVHVIVNNQLGFTTAPHHSRSSEYATDIAKMVSAPIIHVNGDDPEACVRVVRLAMAYREQFQRDVVVDMICYRRHGHNEGDEPAFTQPIMYEAIEKRRSVRKVYTEELVNRGDLTLDEAESALEEFRATLESALTETRESKPTDNDLPPPPEVKGVLDHVDTGVPIDRLQQITKALTTWPEDFKPHPKLARMLNKRTDLLSQDAVDWPMAEMLAMGTLVQEGTSVRFAGQDSRRGTFSQRHSVLVDHATGAEYLPLRNLEPVEGQTGQFMIYDSPLHEFGALGFEYGYSVARPESLTVWEAQFGDFSNGAQVVIDQFITAAEDKWDQRSRMVILLPHGYEGQGPEHSSARIERWLTLCAQDNIQVAQPTTAAQYFHLLRRQMRRSVVKPLVVFTPKSMLRAKHVLSPAADFTDGGFAETLTEDGGPPSDEVRRVVVCSGKVRHDLIAARDEREAPATVVALEQLYPFPQDQLESILRSHPDLEDVMWVQDEPENMGPWPFAGSRLYNACEAVSDQIVLKRATRFESASPATGSHTIHDLEQEKLMDDAFAGLEP